MYMKSPHREDREVLNVYLSKFSYIWIYSTSDMKANANFLSIYIFKNTWLQSAIIKTVYSLCYLLNRLFKNCRRQNIWLSTLAVMSLLAQRLQTCHHIGLGLPLLHQQNLIAFHSVEISATDKTRILNPF